MNVTAQSESSGPAISSAGAIRLLVYPASAWPRIAPVWRELFQCSASRSVFLSPAWTETWLEHFSRDLGVSILLFERAEAPVAACLIVESRPRRAAIPVRRLSLNASGEDARESTYIEYNDVLCRSGYEQAVGEALADYVSGREWEEFALDGLSTRSLVERLRPYISSCDVEETEQRCYYVDLSALRSSGTRYAAALRSHYRRILARNIKAYSELGELRLQCAGAIDEALGMLNELADLNQRRWSSRRRPSSFESARFLAFHRAFVVRSFDDGLIQIVKLRAGEHTVGILYNFVLDGKVYFYQCGYNFENSDHLSPGIVTHAYAVEHAMTCGLDDWDFLAGESLFKRSLSTGARKMVWATFRRRSVKMFALRVARAGRRFIANCRPLLAGCRGSNE
jgi:CelD/BcsL family acetyltransferase involved in cellulose biosynthesis